MRLTQKHVRSILIVIGIMGILLVISYLLTTLVLKKNIFVSNIIYSPINKNGVNSSPSGELKYYYEYKPDTNIDYKPEWASSNVVFTINSDTLNERFNYTVEKPANVYRIVTLGDSFTFGLGVNTKDNWPEKLEDMLNKNLPCGPTKKFEVINLGMEGYGVEYIAHRYLTRGFKYNPDLILWYEAGSGFSRMNEVLESYRQRIAPTITDKEMEEARSNGNYYLAWSRATDEINKDYTSQQIANIIGSAWHKFFNIRGAAPVVVTIPYDTWRYKVQRLKSWISNQRDVVLNDTGVNLNENPKTMELPDGHPTEFGHQLIAENIYKFITTNYTMKKFCNNP
jgi:hypothetical protein